MKDKTAFEAWVERRNALAAQLKEYILDTGDVGIMNLARTVTASHIIDAGKADAVPCFLDTSIRTGYRWIKEFETEPKRLPSILALAELIEVLQPCSVGELSRHVKRRSKLSALLPSTQAVQDVVDVCAARGVLTVYTPDHGIGPALYSVKGEADEG